MPSDIIAGISAVGGKIIDFVFKILFRWFEKRLDKKGKVAEVIPEKKIETYQQAYLQSEKLKKVIHANAEDRYEVVAQVKDWYDNNNLSLSPEIREAFVKAISDVSFYDIRLEDFKATLRMEGKDSENTKIKRRELFETYDSIVSGLQKKIQAEIDQH